MIDILELIQENAALKAEVAELKKLLEEKKNENLIGSR